MSYSTDYDILCRLAQALLYIEEVLENNPVTYPSAIIAFNTVRFGQIVNINTECDETGDKCVISTNVPVGGIAAALADIAEAKTQLEQEIEFGEVTERHALDDTEEG